MKRFVICLLFLFTVVWSWNTTVNYFGPENLVAEKMTGSDDKVVQKLDEVISALMEANHFTNLSVQPTLSFTSNIARRYRPGGFTFDKFMEYQLEEREMLLKNHLKKLSFSRRNMRPGKNMPAIISFPCVKSLFNCFVYILSVH